MHLRDRRTHFSVLVKIHLERLDIFLETQSAHGPKQVVPVDSFTLFLRAFIAGPASLADDSPDKHHSWKIGF